MVDVILFGSGDCHKTQYYRNFLNERGVVFEDLDVVSDQQAADTLRTFYTDGALKFPTLIIKGRKLRNPSDIELQKTLARKGLIESEIVHEEQGQRFVKYMEPHDAFVSYSIRDDKITLTHVEIPMERRGSGAGARLALSVFPLVKEMGLKANITCGFMRKVAASRPEWAEYFGLRT